MFRRLIKWAFKKYCLNTMGCHFITAINIAPTSHKGKQECKAAIEKYSAVTGAAQDQLKATLEEHTDGTWVQDND